MDPDVEWEYRRLCLDEACIGIIGQDGRCNVCGTQAPEAGGPFRSSPLSGDAAAAEAEEAEAAREPSAAADFDDDQRELCPDDACIGLIGADGRCKECGKTRATSG